VAHSSRKGPTLSLGDVTAIVGFVSLFALIALRVPIGIAMGLVGVFGFAAIRGLDPALNLLATSPVRAGTEKPHSGRPRLAAAIGGKPLDTEEIRDRNCRQDSGNRNTIIGPIKGKSDFIVLPTTILSTSFILWLYI
jgi:xanthosine utilization system XapX-like protein